MMATMAAMSEPAETHICLTQGQDAAMVYTEDKNLWKRLAKIGRCVRKSEYHGRIVAKEFILPVSAVVIGGAAVA